MLKQETSNTLFNKAQKFIPGGVNSPVRAFKAVGGNPLFIKAANGAYMYDEDGNRYIDMINSWGPMILGHAHPMGYSMRCRLHSCLTFVWRSHGPRN